MESRQEVYQEVKNRVENDPTASTVPATGRCLFWTLHGLEVLRARGFRALLQAGSAGWRRLRPDQDDGLPTTCTHFSYMWTPTELPSLLAMAHGHMPEIHVWIGLPDLQEVVDLTTGFFQEQARDLGAFDWPGDPPPLFFWGTIEELGDRGFYRPDMDAIRFAFKALTTIYPKDRVKGIV